jgi:GTP-binding protein
LRKSLAMHMPVVVAINKIDRPDARPAEVLNEVYDLFIDLGAEEHQLDFPVLYTNGRLGTATHALDVPGKDLRPLVDAVVKTLKAPEDKTDEPFLMQVNQLSYDDYVGRLVIGRVQAGKVKQNNMVSVKSPDKSYDSRVTGVFTFHGVKRIPLAEARCGDIIALAGLTDVAIGHTICDPLSAAVLAPIKVDEPTVAMVFQVNDGPFAGKSGGKYVTSRHLRDRLYKESYANPSIRVQDGESPEQIRVLGRGELSLAVLIESMRRELFELCVRNPEVVTRDSDDGSKQEPVERLYIDVPVAHMGAVTELLGPRKAQMVDQKQEGTRVRMEYIIPTRGLFGLRNAMMTTTRGLAIAHSIFEGWKPWGGPIPKRSLGALVADRTGPTTPYAIFNLQPRGTMFVPPGANVYEGMIVGEHSRDNDLNVNICREKKLTNIRAAGRDENIIITTAREMTLERCIEWIKDDEMVEVTPEAIRLRKRILSGNRRPTRSED